MRRSSLVLAVLGVLLVASGAVVRFVIAPGVTDLPSDLNTTVPYTGKGTLLNASALISGDLLNVLARNVDVTSDQHVFVSKTDGNTAVVHVESTLTARSTKIEQKHVYAVDRTTRAEANAPAGETVDPHTGLTVAFPVDPKPDNSYKYWDPVTQTSGTLNFVGTETKGGRETNHYTAEISGPVKDPQLAGTLPPALPRPLAGQLLPLLPADVQAKLAPLAAALPDLIPLTYNAKSTYDLWADTTLGAPLDTTIKQSVVASASLAGQELPLLSVLDLSLNQTPASVQSRADEVGTASTQLALLDTWLPLALLVVGAALVVLAIVRRKPKPATATAPEPTEPTEPTTEPAEPATPDTPTS